MVEGLTRPLCPTAAASRWEGELEIKTGALLAGDRFLFYPEDFIFLLTVAGPASTGGSGVLSSSRNDPQGGEGSQHPAPHKGAQD